MPINWITQMKCTSLSHECRSHGPFNIISPGYSSMPFLWWIIEPHSKLTKKPDQEPNTAVWVAKWWEWWRLGNVRFAKAKLHYHFIPKGEFWGLWKLSLGSHFQEQGLGVSVLWECTGEKNILPKYLPIKRLF